MSELKLIKLLKKQGYLVIEKENFWRVENDNIIGFVIKNNCNCQYINNIINSRNCNVYFDNKILFDKWTKCDLQMNYNNDFISEIIGKIQELEGLNNE